MATQLTPEQQTFLKQAKAIQAVGFVTHLKAAGASDAVIAQRLPAYIEQAEKRANKRQDLARVILEGAK